MGGRDPSRPVTDYTGSGTHASLPESERGVAVQWCFSTSTDEFFLTSRADQVTLLELVGTGDARSIESAEPLEFTQQKGPAGTVVTQTIYLQIVPDHPRTVDVDESAVEASGLGFAVTCSNAGPTSCGVSFRPGDRVHIGVLARSNGINDVTIDSPSPYVQANRTCAP